MKFTTNMSWVNIELFTEAVPLTITTQQIYDSINESLDNGILTISEEIQNTPRGKHKIFIIFANCRAHNPLFKKMDVRERVIMYIDQTNQIKRIKFNVVIH
jgi:hypothetical protein